MNYLNKLIGEIEYHSAEGIRECFRNGINPNDLFNNESLIYELTSEYTRSPEFKHCVKAFIDHGLEFSDPLLLAVLADDFSKLESLIKEDPEVIYRKYTLRCAYTPLLEASLLHICAEFNHVSCAEILVKNGLDVNVKAGTDENGFGGQTAIFHTVNQNRNQSAEMMDFLLANNANLTITVPGIIWGKGYEWETLIPTVNPISYAMMGLLPQFHRDETTISIVVRKLLKSAFGIEYPLRNIPNTYLSK